MRNIKKIFARKLRILTLIITVIMFAFILVTQMISARSEAYQDALSRFTQIGHILKDNKADGDVVRADFHANNLRSARIAAYMMTHHPDILEDAGGVREIAMLLGVDEIWVFDESGTIFSGTDPTFHGLTLDSGEQMAFFKPMLKDKSMKLSQDIMPRTADGLLFQYSAVWNDTGSMIVQVGTTAEHAAMVMERFDISYVFSALRVNLEADYYAIAPSTGVVAGSTDEDYIGKDLTVAGFDITTVSEDRNGFYDKIDGVPSFCVFTELNGNYVGRIMPVSELYGDAVQKCFELILVLILAAFAFMLAVSKYTDKLVIKNIYHVNEKLAAITAGHLSERVDLRDSVEFSDLSNYINDMVDSLKERVREQEHLFDIVAQHSQRTLFQYDIASCSVSAWGGKETIQGHTLWHLYADRYSEAALFASEYIMPDSKEDLRQFFVDIHAGVPSGEVTVSVREKDGQPAWCHCKYSCLYAGDRPVTALISVENITDAHKHELSYLRFEQSIDDNVSGLLGYLEVDLTMNSIERHTGKHFMNLRSFEGEKYDAYYESGFSGLAEESRIAALHVYTRENLIDQFNRGINKLENVWQTAFNNECKWVKITVELLKDPLSGHVKMYAQMTDLTQEYEKRMEVAHRADYDTMTGLYRKDTGERLIKEYMRTEGRKGGILIALDLDDLKSINDNLGHGAGDAAINGIAATLKEHFRSDDIIVRAGGDEFMVFLLDAAQSAESVSVSMTSLLQKLSRISVGGEDGRAIHCSAGCAVELPDTDTFATLFKRADTALYHVKRSGKNNFAFYVPEMERADYEFRAQRLMSMNSQNRFNFTELQYLLDSIMKFYQLVLAVDISNNTYFIMDETTDGIFSKVPTFGKLTDFVNLSAAGVHPDDRDSFMDHVSREGLLQQYEQGHKNLHTHFRFFSGEKYSWVECMVIFYVNENGDVCDFTMLRWAADRTSAIEQLRLQKILELSSGSAFEYVCLIDVESGIYSTFSRDEDNSHKVPKTGDFEEVSRCICENNIAEESRQVYIEHSSIEHLLEHMKQASDTYSYRYVMLDGITREATFTWYEDSHFELLLTVRKITE